MGRSGKNNADDDNIAKTIQEKLQTGEYTVVQGVFNKRTRQVVSDVNTEQVVRGGSVFISYSRADSQFVDRLENDLKVSGYTCWIDRSDLTGGQNWVRMIQEAIDSCQAVVVVLSPDSATSSWVQRECLYALEVRKLVVPLIWKSGFKKPFELIERQVIDFSINYARGLTSLVKALS